MRGGTLKRKLVFRNPLQCTMMCLTVGYSAQAGQKGLVPPSIENPRISRVWQIMTRLSIVYYWQLNGSVTKEWLRIRLYLTCQNITKPDRISFKPRSDSERDESEGRVLESLLGTSLRFFISFRDILTIMFRHNITITCIFDSYFFRVQLRSIFPVDHFQV